MTHPEPFLLLGETVQPKKAKTDFKGGSPIHSTGEGHLITVAPTGAGKGVSCIIPALLTWTGPTIVIDPKGENYAVTAERRRQMGQQVHVLDPFGVTDTEEPARLNPLDLVDAKSPDFHDAAAMVARIICSERSHKDPYWDERAETLITGLIIETVREGCSDLGFVRQMVQRDSAYIGGEQHPIVPLVSEKTAAAIYAMGSPTTRSCIISCASSHTSFLRTGLVLKSFDRSTISIADVAAGLPMTIYLVLPPDKLLSHGKVLRLWVGVLMSVLSTRRHKPELPTLFLIDEAAQLGELNELRTAITLLRGYGVKVWSFWQDLAQLKRLYPDWESILNNCSVQQYFGATTPHAERALEELLPRRSCIRPGALDPGSAILITPGNDAQVVKLPNYLNDSALAAEAMPNPFYQNQPRSRSADVIPFRARLAVAGEEPQP